LPTIAETTIEHVLQPTDVRICSAAAAATACRSPMAARTMNLHQRVTACDARRQSKTSSRCVAESATVTHDFEVAGYSQLKALGVGQYVSSGTFSAGGHNWAIRVYPKQYGNVIAHYQPPLFYAGASLQLRDAGVGTEVTASFTLSLLQKDGRVSPMAKRTMTAAFGAPPRDSYGFHKLLASATMLQKWRCLHNDALTIRCVLTVVRTRDPVPPPELAGHLGSLLATGMGADVTFDVGGRAFPAHRVLLAARSPVFRAELFGHMMEKDARRIRIAGVRPEIFELLLHFIYTDSLPGDGEGCDTATLQHLLVAADLYGIDRLKHICEGKLHASVDEKTVASMLALAERHNCPRLRDACLNPNVHC
jgi:speckle-type POZ protein